MNKYPEYLVILNILKDYDNQSAQDLVIRGGSSLSGRTINVQLQVLQDAGLVNSIFDFQSHLNRRLFSITNRGLEVFEDFTQMKLPL